MADTPHTPNTNADSATGRGAPPEHEAAPGTPRWVIVFGVVALALVVVVVVVHLAGGGMGAMMNHGMPRR